ncbi:MAG: hypothetical protein WAQ98_07570, partial [Blastocatellia bacterium]
FSTQKSKLSVVIGTTVLFDVILPPTTTNEIIEVTATSNLLTEGKTESSTIIDNSKIALLPINRRNFLDFSLTTPRVTRDRTPAEGVVATSGLSFNGQSARTNNITIDGLDNNDLSTGAVRATFSQDAVQEFQVVSDGYSAEFGRALGGVVNIVTKTGKNQYNGNLYFLLRNDSISAKDSFSSFEPEYKQYQFGSTFGGPIKRDKVFFFTSFERLSIKQNNIVIIDDNVIGAARRQGFNISSGPVPFSLGTSSFLTRLDSQITSNNKLWIRFNRSGNYDGNFESFGGLIGETRGGVLRVDDTAIAASNTYLSINLNLVNETRFLYSRRSQNVLPLDSGPQVRIDAFNGRASFGRNQFLPQPRETDIYQIVNNTTLVRGKNQIKFGVDFSKVDVVGQLPFFAGGIATFSPLDFSVLGGMPGLPFFTSLEAFDSNLRTPQQKAFLNFLSGLLPQMFPGFPNNLPLADLSLPTVYLQGFGTPNLSFATKVFSAFLQDDIKVKPNLLLKVGFRYDINRIDFNPSNKGNFSPRLAIAYRPVFLPKLSVHAGYGLFFAAPFTGTSAIVQATNSGTLKLPTLTFPFSVIPFSLPNRQFPESDQLPPGVTSIAQLGQVFQFQPNLRNSYSQQIGLGIDYIFGENTKIAANYQFVRGIKLVSQREINPIVNPIIGDPIQSAIIGRIDPSRGSLREFESAFDSYYHALTLSAERKLSSKVSFLAYYTFSKAIDNFQDFRTEARSNPLRPGDDRALSLQDVRSRFGFSGIWKLDYTKNALLRDFQLSTILILESGRPFNLDAGVDLNLDGDDNDRPLAIARNAGITPGFANLDLRLQRKIKIKEKYQLDTFFEVFNVFNRVNIDPNASRSESFPPDANGQFNLPPQDNGRFILPVERYRKALAPRQCQIGIKFTF